MPEMAEAVTPFRQRPAGVPGRPMPRRSAFRCFPRRGGDIRPERRLHLPFRCRRPCKRRPAVRRLWPGGVANPGGKGHINPMTASGFHNGILRTAGTLLNRR